jgi:peroxiredoxin
MKPIFAFLKRHSVALVLAVLLAGYVVVAGTTRSCPTCAAATDFLGLSSSASAAEPAATPAAYPSERAEPVSVGDPVPDGTLRRPDGGTVGLHDALGGRPAVLVFYRGGWCPFCLRHLQALSEAAPEIEGSGFGLFAISPDRPAKLRAHPDLEGAPYTLLSDSPMTLARAFGIAFKLDDEFVEKYKNEYGIDLEADSGQTHHLLPHPSVFVVDADGTVRFAHVNPDYKERLSPEDILEALGP